MKPETASDSISNRYHPPNTTIRHEGQNQVIVMEVFYQKDDYVKAEVDRDRKLLHITWYNISDDDIFKECLLTQLELVKSGMKIILVNSESAKGSNSKEITKWIDTDFIPRLSDAGLQTLIICTPGSQLSKKSSSGWIKLSQGHNFSAYETADMESAEKLIEMLS